MGPADLDDFYAITLPDDGTLNFTLTTNGSLQARTVVYNASGSVLLFGGFVTGGTTAGSVSCLAAGTVYVHVDRNAGDDAYTLDLSLASPVEANDPEPNGSIGTALSLPFTGSAEGHSGFGNGSVVPVDADDYYLTLPVEEGHPPHPGARGSRGAGPSGDRHDGQRHQERARPLPGRGHERLRDQALRGPRPHGRDPRARRVAGEFPRLAHFL